MVNLKVCHSEFVDTTYAMNDIFKQSEDLKTSDVKGIMVFSSYDFDLVLISKRLKEKYPGVKIIGGSSYGEMSSCLGWREDSLLVGFLYGENFEVQTIGFENIGENLDSKLKESFSKITDIGSSKICILATDALTIGGEAVMRDFRKYIPETLPVIGGMTADQWVFIGTKQIHNEETYKKGLVAMFISGDFEAQITTEAGWEPYGKKAVVTKSDGHIVHEINNFPALDFYAETFGTRDGTFGEYPLGIYKNNEITYFRAPLTWDQKTGSMSFAGAVPTGEDVAISSASREQVLKATDTAIRKSSAELKNGASWAFITSCAARRQLLGTQAGKEIEIAREVLGDIPILGFSVYGEYFDLKAKYPGTPGFLNECFCVVTIGKK